MEHVEEIQYYVYSLHVILYSMRENATLETAKTSILSETNLI